jgi:hypothetical protein
VKPIVSHPFPFLHGDETGTAPGAALSFRLQVALERRAPSVALGEEGSAALTAFRSPSASSRARHTFPRELDERDGEHPPGFRGLLEMCQSSSLY